jgi:hypothetical protein
MKRLKNVSLLVIGSVLVYCGQVAVYDRAQDFAPKTTNNDAAPASTASEKGVANAQGSSAAASCQACSRPAPVMLFDGKLAQGAYTNPIDIRACRSVVLHCELACHVYYRFGVAGWVNGGALSGEAQTMMLSPELGNEIRVLGFAQNGETRGVTIVGHPF